jgi:electron transfer flavoprotein alpha subunit
MKGDIFVLVEHLKGEISDITFELLSCGKAIKEQTGGTLFAILLGHNLKSLIPDLGCADKVIYVDDENLSEFSPEAYKMVLVHLLREKDFLFFLVGNTSYGMDIASALAAELEVSCVVNCKDFRFEEDNFIFITQTHGGKILNEVSVPNKAVISILPGSFSAEEGKREGSPSIEEIKSPVSLSTLKVRFKRIIEPEITDVDISKQNILVSVGRGIQSKDNIPLVEELAQLLGGVVGSTRPVIDQGWLPLSRLIGRSGKAVKPKLYLALGISGALEHQEGMKGSELIIAVNTDPTAPIFDIAHYGVEKDLFEIVPLIVQRLKERKGS